MLHPSSVASIHMGIFATRHPYVGALGYTLYLLVKLVLLVVVRGGGRGFQRSVAEMGHWGNLGCILEFNFLSAMSPSRP